MTVGEFMDLYGSRETIDFLFGKLLGESFVRTCREVERRVLSSRRRLGESKSPSHDDDLYHLIVRELRESIRR
jgi:hypothetical protein